MRRIGVRGLEWWGGKLSLGEVSRAVVDLGRGTDSLICNVNNTRIALSCVGLSAGKCIWRGYLQACSRR